ncbi:MAG TPA: 4Fe-4S dicluster domain-containing protein [Arcobacter sp.]|nr:4Fe-4S dicluster domain-containing protein [Arcobacter sp.]
MSERLQHRGKLISVNIDGKSCDGIYGQTILEIARENDIYIPTMCHVTKLSPIASCRMCAVNVEGVEGHILSCQEKAVNGAVVTTNNEGLEHHRQNIMKLYNVNHPLQCGVCDKSGECELQNKTLEFKLDSQEFAVKDVLKKKKGWGVLSYDPALCIMCERCVHTCNEIIGASALYIKPGGYESTIDNKMSRCEQCGECITVCPVGAMASTDYKYTTNAWESEKIPATCTHCSSACPLYYDVKSAGIDDPYGKIITRVVTDHDFDMVCGAGKFAYSFENKKVSNSSEEVLAATNAIKECDTIKFNSYITNEEALILQKLKEKLGVKLVNNDAYNYQQFLNSYSSITGKSLYSATNTTVNQSDLIIMLGTRIFRDNPVVKYNVNMAIKKQRAQFIYMHPIDDIDLQTKYTQYVKYEVGSEEAVLAMLASYLLKDNNKVDASTKEYLNNLDIGYLSGESSVGEEEYEEILKKLIRRKNKTIIVGSDVYGHAQASNIAKLVAIIDKYTDFNIMLIPTSTNTLGVSLLCDLDKAVSGKVLGYNVLGDYTISNCGSGDFNTPALNQQEGTFTSIDLKVVNTNVALAFDGYCLNDLAKDILESRLENTIDYTKELSSNNEYKAVEFDSLANGYDKYGKDLRGYYLESLDVDTNITLDEITNIGSYNGTVIYNCQPLYQFNEATKKSLTKSLFPKTDTFLKGSKAFATAAKIKANDKVNIIYEGKSVTKVFKIDKDLKGTVALYPSYDLGLNNDLLPVGYRYKQVKIEKVEVPNE